MGGLIYAAYIITLLINVVSFALGQNAYLSAAGGFFCSLIVLFAASGIGGAIGGPTKSVIITTAIGAVIGGLGSWGFISFGPPSMSLFFADIGPVWWLACTVGFGVVAGATTPSGEAYGPSD